MAAPSTPILDSFNRANETPLSNGGLWNGPLSSGDGVFNLSSNAAAGASGGVNNDMWWTQPFGPEQEVYLTSQTGSDIRMYLRLSLPNTAIWNAYEIQFLVSSNSLTIREMVAGANNHTIFTGTMASLGLTTLASGDRYWARIEGRHSTTTWIHVYADFGNTGTWTLVTRQQSGSLTQELWHGGFIGALNFSNGTAFDDFGGGEVLPTSYESLRRRPVPMMRGPDTDQIMRINGKK